MVRAGSLPPRCRTQDRHLHLHQNADGLKSPGHHRLAHMARSLREKIIEAEERGSRYLADANEAAERGDREKADKLYEKGQYWLDRYNKLVGNG